MSSIREIVDRVNSKQPVFTVTAGRTGTTYVSRLFALLPDTYSVHESKPNFVTAMRKAQLTPKAGMDFCTQIKLPHIAALSESRYVEMSHLFCKGFLECFVKLGVNPSLLILRRPPRTIALSLLSRQTVPARTAMGWRFLLAPNDRGVLPLDRWQLLTDYQLCFWYCLEIERRQALYQHYMMESAGRYFSVDVDALRDYSVFSKMLTTFGFSWDQVFDEQLRQSHQSISNTQHNLNRKSLQFTEERLTQWENEVWDIIGYSDPGLRLRVQNHYGSN